MKRIFHNLECYEKQQWRRHYPQQYQNRSISSTYNINSAWINNNNNNTKNFTSQRNNQISYAPTTLKCFCLDFVFFTNTITWSLIGLFYIFMILLTGS